jgi:hypothetical protein
MKNQNNWKNQLRNRKITPSDEAWLAIEAGLGKKDTKTLKTKFIFSLIAASIVGFIVYITLPSATIDAGNTDTVNTENSTELQKPAAQEDFNLDVNSKITVNDNEVIEAEETPSISTATDAKQAKLHSTSISNVVAESSNKINSEKSKNSIPETNLASIEEVSEAVTPEKSKPQVSEKAMQLLSEVEAELAQVVAPDTSYRVEDEAEALLSQAKLIIQEVEYDKLYQFAKASDLLAEVEGDIPKDNLQNRVWSFVKDKAQDLESTLASLK